VAPSVALGFAGGGGGGALGIRTFKVPAEPGAFPVERG
jgi:hypothetical protein